ncbi:unnamed protein product, partial [Strongylus vulgaris]
MSVRLRLEPVIVRFKTGYQWLRVVHALFKGAEKVEIARCSYRRLVAAEAKPTLVSIGTATEEVQKVETAAGETVQFCSIGTETQTPYTVEFGVDALRIDVHSVECQTSPATTAEVGVDVEPIMADAECQTSPATMAEVGVDAEPIMADAVLQTDEHARAHFGVNTDKEKLKEVETTEQSTATEVFEKAASVDRETMTTRIYYRNIPIQTDTPEEEEAQEVIVPDSCANTASSDAECQTETVIAPDSNVESIASDDITGDTAVIECARCRLREETFTRNVGVGACAISDKVCIECDKATPDEVDENDAPGFKPDKDDVRTKEFDLARVTAIKKLLTSEQKQPFVRGTAISRSARLERNKGDDLEYIAEKNK